MRNSNVTFTCTSEGNPPPHEYRFFHEDTLLGNSSSGMFHTKVTKSGLYSCVPVNKAGEGQKRSVNITVVGELFGFMCLYKSSLSCCDRKLFILRSSCFILQCTIVSDWWHTSQCNPPTPPHPGAMWESVGHLAHKYRVHTHLENPWILATPFH